jgi:hypothetical protein
MRLLEDGDKMREVNVFLNVNEHLVSSLTCGTKSQYEDVWLNCFQIKCPSTKQSDIWGNHEMVVEVDVDCSMWWWI